jgi:hypothetical protein
MNVRDKLGLLLVEDEKGGIAVQLFERPEPLAESFEQFKGRIGDKPSRATMLVLDWPAPSKVAVGCLQAKDLPEKVDTPWGWRIGQGPMVKPEDCVNAKDKKAPESDSSRKTPPKV